jgi:hypothetical protein
MKAVNYSSMICDVIHAFLSDLHSTGIFRMSIFRKHRGFAAFGSLPTMPLPLLPCLFIDQQKRPFSGPWPVSYWFTRLCVGANGYWRFILSYARANGDWFPVFHVLPLSYINRNFGKLIPQLYEHQASTVFEEASASEVRKSRPGLLFGPTSEFLDTVRRKEREEKKRSPANPCLPDCTASVET